MSTGDEDFAPLFQAVSSSARQLFVLLRCIGFASKAQVRISNEGLRFTVEESRVMQGLAFLEKGLFTSFTFTPPAAEHLGDDETGNEITEVPSFQISLSALLETLQIFGITDTKDRWANREPAYSGVNGLSSGGGSSAFDNRVLGMTGICRLSYRAIGEPLCVILEEAGVTTTCELTTYQTDLYEEIPLQKDALMQKIIMRASWLHDAVVELSSTSPTRLTIVASNIAPFFALSSTGPLGSATVEFSKDPQLLETFQVKERTVNTYKYALIKGASRAMSIASKVSIRGDEQGVLSLQFMIEVEGGGVSFVDFKFVPFVADEGEGDESEDEAAIMQSSTDRSESFEKSRSLEEGFIHSENGLQSRKPFKAEQSCDSSSVPPPPSEHDTDSTDTGSFATVQYYTAVPVQYFRAGAVRVIQIMAPRNTASPQPEMNRNRLPTLFEVLNRQSLAPVDLFSFYIYMRDQQRSVDYLDFWLDVTQHMSLCRHYVRELRRSVLVDTPELEKAGSKRSSYILDHMGDMNDPSGPSAQLNTDEKVRDQHLSAYLRQENGNGNGAAHSPHSSLGSQQSALRGSADRSTGNERPPRASFMTSGSSPLHPTDSSSPLHVVARTDIRSSAEKILYTFLLPGSEREIILPQSIMNDITASIEEDGRDDPEVFDAAKDYTFQAMERDAFPGFLRAKALGNLVPLSALLRVALGLLAFFGGSWAGFVLIFLDATRHVRCWVILPLTIGVYCIASHQYDMDPILALAGLSEYTFMNWSKIHDPYVRKLLNKRAVVALVVAIVFAVVANLIFILVPGYPL